MHRQHHVRAVHARVVLSHAVLRLQRTKQAAQLGPVELACVDEAMPIEQRLAEQQQAWGWSAAILILGASRGELLGPPRASELLRLRSGIRRSGLSPGRHQAG